MILIIEETRRGKLRGYNTDKQLIAIECITCGEFLPVDRFNKKGDGHHTVCRSCCKKYKAKHYVENIDKIKTKLKEHSTKYAARISAYQRKYRQEHKDHLAAEKKAWGQANREHCSNKSKEWAKNNPEKRKAILRDSARKTKDTINKRKRRWRKENPEKNIRTDRRINRRLGHVRYFCSAVREIKIPVKLANKGKNPSEHITVDHIIPLVNAHICGLECPANMQILNRSENASKNNQWDGTYDNNSWRESYVP
jgi:hypothetical protein